MWGEGGVGNRATTRIAATGDGRIEGDRAARFFTPLRCVQNDMWIGGRVKKWAVDVVVGVDCG